MPKVVNTPAIDPVGGHTANSSLSSAVTLPPPTGANALLIQALTQNVRLRLDGTAPTASTGFQLKAGDPPTLINVGTSTIKVIEETSGGVVQYQWVK